MELRYVGKFSSALFPDLEKQVPPMRTKAPTRRFRWIVALDPLRAYPNPELPPHDFGRFLRRCKARKFRDDSEPVVCVQSLEACCSHQGTFKLVGFPEQKSECENLVIKAGPISFGVGRSNPQ